MNRLPLLLIVISLSFSQFTAIKTNNPPEIDGLIESTWERGLKFDKFVQRWPNLHAEPTVKSTVYLMYDETNIYIAGKFYQDPNTIKGTRYRRDVTDLWNDDWFQFNVDPFNSGVSGFYLGLNPANALIDGKLGPFGQEDESWDGIIITQTQINSDHWSFEVKIPMNTLDFQNQDVQTWAMTFGRNYSNNQEQIWTHEIPKDNHLLMTSYLKIHEFENLRKGEPYKGTPYIYYGNEQDNISDGSLSDEKIGFDFLYQPNPATNITVTVNPDFAQLESDPEVINVSDIPTQYPEKRPFFTNNSEFYGPAPGIRTRNIGEINAGLKLVQSHDKFKYDMTYVNDDDNNNWYFADFIYDNSENFKIEFIGAVKNQAYKDLGGGDFTPDRTMLNGVLSTNYWMYDKRLSFWSFLEMNNVVDTHYGTRSGVNYRVREYYLGYTVDVKHTNYNSGEIGYFLLSNNNDHTFNSNYSIFFDDNDALLRQMRFGLNVYYRSLYSHSEENYTQFWTWGNAQLFINRTLGNWWFNVNYSPDTGQKFRYYNDNGQYVDNIYTFDMVKQKQSSFNFNINTDGSKMVSGYVYYNNAPVRQATSDRYGFGLTLKPMSEVRISYDVDFIDTKSSPYWNAYEQDVHRLRAEYNVTDRLNLRVIYSLDALSLPLIEQTDENDLGTGVFGYETETPTFNITGSWEYEPGSFAYLVYNRFSSEDRFKGFKFDETANNSSIILKVNKSFRF